MNEKTLLPGIKFSPTVELGHLLQALVMLAAIGGWGIAGYYSIDKQIAQQAAKMELFQQRLSAYETGSNELRENLRLSVIETRTSLAKISDQLSDLRTLVASQTHDAPAHR
jgi:cell division protein FtsB